MTRVDTPTAHTQYARHPAGWGAFNGTIRAQKLQSLCTAEEKEKPFFHFFSFTNTAYSSIISAFRLKSVVVVVDDE